MGYITYTYVAKNKQKMQKNGKLHTSRNVVTAALTVELECYDFNEGYLDKKWLQTKQSLTWGGKQPTESQNRSILIKKNPNMRLLSSTLGQWICQTGTRMSLNRSKGETYVWRMHTQVLFALNWPTRSSRGQDEHYYLHDWV